MLSAPPIHLTWYKSVQWWLRKNNNLIKLSTGKLGSSGAEGGATIIYIYWVWLVTWSGSSTGLYCLVKWWWPIIWCSCYTMHVQHVQHIKFPLHTLGGLRLFLRATGSTSSSLFLTGWSQQPGARATLPKWWGSLLLPWWRRYNTYTTHDSCFMIYWQLDGVDWCLTFLTKSITTTHRLSLMYRSCVGSEQAMYMEGAF